MAGYAAVFTVVGISTLLFIRPTDSREFSQCYNVTDKTYCFYTYDSVGLNWSEARQFCLNRSATLPIITDQNVQGVFQTFLSDSSSVLPNVDVWIGARTVPVNRSVPWHWMNGTQYGEATFQNHNDHNWCVSIGRDSSGNQLVLFESAWNNPEYYICHYNKANCDAGFTHYSLCYQVHQQPATWFEAVNRCLSLNGTLAVFDEAILSSFKSYITNTHARIGLMKSWWRWPDLDADVTYTKWSAARNQQGLPKNPELVPNRGRDCAAARTDWEAVGCSTRKHVVCQIVSNISTSVPPESTTNRAVAVSENASNSLPAAAATTTPKVTAQSTKGHTNGDSDFPVLPVALGAGIGGGVLILAIIIIVIAVICCRKRRHKSPSGGVIEAWDDGNKNSSEAVDNAKVEYAEMNGTQIGGGVYANIEQPPGDGNYLPAGNHAGSPSDNIHYAELAGMNSNNTAPPRGAEALYAQVHK